MNGAVARPALAGVSVYAAADDEAIRVAAWLLGRLGATVTSRRGETIDVAMAVGAVDPGVDAPAARLVGPEPTDAAGLPAGTLRYANGLCTAGAALLALLAGDDVEVDARDVAVQVLLPLVLAEEHGLPFGEPPPPRPIGDGHVACDFAGRDDEEIFEHLLASLGDAATDPRAVADEAQAWRLPVCAYQRRPSPAHMPPSPFSTGIVPDTARAIQPARETVRRDAGAPLAGTTICDLTTMWAGPLATWLMASAGADVHKIEPSMRVDGLRFRDDSGDRSTDTDARRGLSAHFVAVNRGKRRRDLDLRDNEAMAELVDVVTGSDLVVDSFSRRVMPNLGLGQERLRQINPTIGTVSMPAFPADHPWQVALGPGIHAASGLGDVGHGHVAAPIVAYPDPLAGFTAFATSLALLVARRRGAQTAHHDVTLLECTTPLLALSGPSPVVADRDPQLASRVLDESQRAAPDAWEQVDARRRVPRSPFRGRWAPVPLGPAPTLPASIARTRNETR